MSYAQMGRRALDYEPCQYPGSQMVFRGPQIDPLDEFVLCLGGSETFGKYTPDPFPDRLADRIGKPVVNMGAMNAGLDLFINDPAIASALDRADAVVLQIPGAANMSNRFFTVHPRRNDRFLKASNKMRQIYHDLDFTEFHFTRHMLTALRHQSEERFALVIAELRTAWRARMALLLDRINAPVHLLWLSQRAPEDDPVNEEGLGYDPLFVTRHMVDEIAPFAASMTISIWNDKRVPDQRGLTYSKGEEAAARLMPGPRDHERVSQELAQLLCTT